MNRLHYVAKSMNVLNCLLALAVAAAAYDLVVPYLNIKIQQILPAPGKTALEPETRPSSPSLPPFHDYTMVSEQNLFHPQRRIPPEKIDEKASVAAPVPKPDLILYGTLIADNLSIAYVEDRKAPFSTPGRGKRQTQLKKGDSVNGFVVKEIEPNRIILVRGEEKLSVLLDVKDRNRGGDAAPGDTAGLPASPGGLPGALPPRFGTPAVRPVPGLAPAGSRLPQRSATPAASGSAAVLSGAGSLPAPSPAISPGTATPAASAASPATAATSPGSPEATPPGTAPTSGYTPTKRGGPYYTRPGARPYDIRPVPVPATKP